MTSDQIIIEPLLTEKSNQQRDKRRYTFKVLPSANKKTIMWAVAQQFSVRPISCNIINVKGKPRRVRNRAGYTASWKKAIVVLPKNESISAFERI